MPSPVLSVVVPCFNEQEVLEETHKRLTRVLSGVTDAYEIVYVNDGSRDGTRGILDALADGDPHVRALHFARNGGHQIAVTAGLDYADGDAVVIIDADLQDPPEVIPEMVEKWRAGAQVIYGKRRRREGESAFKKWTAAAYYKALSWMTNGMVPRDTGDFRLIDRKVADTVRAMPEHDRFLRGMFAWVGYRQEAVLFDRDKRFAGETHYPLKKMLALAANGVFGFSDKPLKFAALTGALWTAGGLIAALILLILALCGTAGGLWWIAALIAVCAGNILLAVGILGEYLMRVYNEARGRPLYIIDETRGFDRSGDD